MTRTDHDDQLKKREAVKEQTSRLYEAGKKGLLPLGGMLQEEGYKHQARRQEILTELAGLRIPLQDTLIKAKISSKATVWGQCLSRKEKINVVNTNASLQSP